MQRDESVGEQARQLVDQLHTLNSDEAGLRVIADKLGILASSPIWRTTPYREAAPGEELVYELALSSVSGPSLYLVSDGAGVVSPPHGHSTWAVIAGIRGCELNRRYTVQSIEKRTVVPAAEVEVRAGQVLVLGPEDVHSTEVRGVSSTFHLHLYGRPLHELPRFESRCHVMGCAQS